LATGMIRIGRASCVCVCIHPYSKNARSLCHYPTPPMWWSLMIILFSVPIKKSNHGNALRQKKWVERTRKCTFLVLFLNYF
jgi:hypothetical protein